MTLEPGHFLRHIPSPIEVYVFGVSAVGAAWIIIFKKVTPWTYVFQH